jgi:aminoglycoside phosphotransferase (APT) family kinase protein
VGVSGDPRLILRRALADRQLEAAVGMEGEAELIRAASEAGVPVPPVRYVMKPEDGVGQGFVDGETLGRKIVRDAAFAEARKTLAFTCGKVLARIHAIPTDDLPSLHASATSSRLEEIYRRYKANGRPRPVISIAIEWLRANLPPEPERPALVHGEFRNGNQRLARTACAPCWTGRSPTWAIRSRT